jgi:hypothetical protein
MTSTRSNAQFKPTAPRSAVMALPLFFVRGVVRVFEIIPKLIEKLAFLE